MKTLMSLIIVSLFSFNMVAGDGNSILKDGTDKYCAKMEDGKLTVMYRGNAITSDVTLADGSKISADGMIMKKDGSEIMLKEGECIDKDGKIMMKEKYKEEEPINN